MTTLIGGRGKGKTDFLKKVVQASNLPKKLIVDVYDNPVWRDLQTHDNKDGANIKVPVLTLDQLPYWKSGTYRIFGSNTDEIKEAIDKYLKNCLLIWEDATKYYGTRLTDIEKRSLYDTKQKNIDAFYVFHSFRKTTIEVLENSDILTLKKTGDNRSLVDRKFENPDITQLFKEVKAHKDKYHTASIFVN
ncbi:MAG TPA: hypothetical protein VFD80_02325 [Flavobacteriaceae bacterium]|nr:hypothetical protein [Flavobacteriaceae bacterium]